VSSELRVPLVALEGAGPLRVEGGAHGICLARVDGAVYAIADRCSHQQWRLSDGEVEAGECSIECTKHGSTFSLKDGQPQCLPATRPVEVYPVRVEGDEIVVELP